MSEQIKIRPHLRGPQGKLRFALLLVVPLAIAFNVYVNNIALSRDIAGLTFVQPVGWQYHSDTAVIPHTRRIHFTAAGFADAVREGHGVPLFVVTRYAAGQGALNPLIGVNVFKHDSDIQLLPEVLLEKNLEQVQQASHEALEVVEPIATLPLGTLPGARVVLKARAGKEASGLNRLTVYALIAGHLSFTIVASDAESGEQAIDKDLAAFISSLAVD
jgi:hypothetical protein